MRGRWERRRGGIVRSICGNSVADMLPDCVANIFIHPVWDEDLASLLVMQPKNQNAIIIMARLPLTASTSIVLYEYQAKRDPKAGKDIKAPPAKRLLVFSVSSLPSLPNIPLIGTLPQPFDQMHFL